MPPPTRRCARRSSAARGSPSSSTRRQAHEPAAGGADDVRRLWEEELIDIVVQPIVDIQYGRMRSYEALARFRVEGDPSPFKWFTLAEEHGLRFELELACLERALRLLPARPFGTRLSVNAGPELLTHPSRARRCSWTCPTRTASSSR